MQLQLTRKKKPGGVVGLDIEAGSIAATEVQGRTARRRCSAAAIEPLAPGVFHEGEVLDPDGLADALKALFSEHKLSKQVRLGIGNQRVVVRTVRLPAIEDPKEMEAAVRFQAQEQIPMPLDQAVLEHQVVGGVPAEEGATPQVDVVVVAARRDMVSSFLEPIRRAGLEPVGVDLSAFAMIRALADAGRRTRPSGAAPDRGRPLLQRRRRHQPRRGARAGVPLHPRLPASAWRRSPSGSAPRRGLSAEHAAQWLAHVGLERPVEEIEGDAVVGRRRAPGARGGALRAARRAAPLARLLRRPGERDAGRADRPLRPRKRDPRPRASGWRSGLGPRSPSPARRRSPASTTSAAARLTLPTASPWRAERCAPST